ncbi:MAG: cation:proton antiporter [Thermosynechococcus sp. Uc]|uniref:cation:proton antiporter domain-containing protein n=1 Tax=Thermosynechococcus sp. Uc TaxID=3034853 RepID=UPI0019FA2F9E|nr:cation:proton antiporter [Thermosynechococcus sp. Uc]MDM7326978.1 cation:proton antiporter [Thermosynechococcus sp. Uc]HIK26296.1 cation:proton antiporter [Thermosynechococcus sp. M46_R2017_013]
MDGGNPIVVFTVLLAVILVIPPLFERLRLPGLVGLLLAGVLLGPNGLQFLEHKSETIQLLSNIGKVYLMFVAGLEIDLSQFRRTRHRSAVFGFFTFIVPIITGIIIGRWFGFGWNSSLLIGSILASHTLLAYPIVRRLGVVQNEAVTITIGATIFTDTAALVILAICVGIHRGEFTLLTLLHQLITLSLYCFLVLWGFDRAGKEFFQRSRDDQGNQFLFILLALFVASVAAQVIGVEQIVGAFLAGLAVNDVLGESPVKEKVEFIGGVLFIPCFFVDMGLLIDIPAFVETLSSIGITAAIVVGLMGSKFVAAWLSALWYRYTPIEMLTIWSLSLPQVAATLATTLVGFQEGILTKDVLNSVLVLMVVTSILGPMITARTASCLPIPQPQQEDIEELANWWDGSEEAQPHPFTVVVPIHNPQTQRSLVELAALLARHESGRVVPVTIVPAQVHMDDPQLDAALNRGRKLTRRAVELAEVYGVEATAALRIDDDVALGISRFSREQNASLIVLGWSETGSLRARLFGNVIDRVLWSSPCPVAITRLLDAPEHIGSILVPTRDLTPSTLRIVRFAQALASSSQAKVVLLHVFLTNTPPEQIGQFEQDLRNILQETGGAIATDIQTVASNNIASTILQEAQNCDLVLMRSIRRGTAGGMAVSDITTQVIRQVQTSIILFGEPHRLS